jgi:hypothetical protein
MELLELSNLVDSGGTLALAVLVWYEMREMQKTAANLLRVVSMLEERTRDGS